MKSFRPYSRCPQLNLLTCLLDQIFFSTYLLLAHVLVVTPPYGDQKTANYISANIFIVVITASTVVPELDSFQQAWPATTNQARESCINKDQVNNNSSTSSSTRKKVPFFLTLIFYTGSMQQRLLTLVYKWPKVQLKTRKCCASKGTE